MPLKMLCKWENGKDHCHEKIWITHHVERYAGVWRPRGVHGNIAGELSRFGEYRKRYIEHRHKRREPGNR